MHGEDLAHLRVNKASWQYKGKLIPEKYIFSKEETQKNLLTLLRRK
jgi:putative ABC transport system permease protein